VINIISINICNKNEIEGNFQGNPLQQSQFNQPDTQNSLLQRQKIINLVKSNLQENPLKKMKTVKAGMNSDNQVKISECNDIPSCKGNAATVVNMNCVNKKTSVSSSPDSNTFEHDFYENSSTSPNFFNDLKEEGEEYDKFFEWN
jgi:hypothetical protein